MMKNGLLNSQLAKMASQLGHTDLIMIADAGLPIPEGVERIDLSLELGTPSFMSVYDLLVKELVIEKLYLANEISVKNQNVHRQILNSSQGIDLVYMSHEDLKMLSSNVKAIIRTGENTPYANIVIQSGCLF